MTPGTKMALDILFAVFSLFTVGGAVIAVFSSRVLRGVAGLAVCSVGLSGLFYFLGSPFIALMEILIYVGAVCIAIVFAIMLAEPEEKTAVEESEERSSVSHRWTAVALLSSLGFFAVLSLIALRHAWAAPAERTSEGTVREIGIALLTTYSLAFELISLVLLAAIVGALAIARAGRRSNP